MLRKEITYTDYNGEKRTDTFYFNLNQRDLVKLNFEKQGTLETRLQGIIDKHDIGALFAMIDEIILAAYGIKSEDGKSFIKRPEIADDFAQTAAYAELFAELCSSNEKMDAFVRGILPPTPTPVPAPAN